MSYIDVRHYGKLLFRYDPDRHLVEIKPRSGQVAVIDLSQIKNGVTMETEGHTVNKLLRWTRSESAISLLGAGIQGIGRFEDGRKFIVFMPTTQEFIDDVSDEVLEQMIRKEVEAMTPDQIIN